MAGQFVLLAGPWGCRLAMAAAVVAGAWPEAEDTCSEGVDCRSMGGLIGAARARYIWPHPRGHNGSYGIAASEGPRKLSEPTWRWHHHDSRFGTIVIGGPLLDDRSNIYLATFDRIYKMDRDGWILWTHKPESMCRINTLPSLSDGAFFDVDDCGNAWAVDMETGQERWSTKVADRVGGDAQSVTVSAGVVLVGVDPNERWGFNGQNRLVALNATDGRLLWERQLRPMTWNLLPHFVGDGTFVFQDMEGGVYRLRLADGSEVWSDIGQVGTLTDGSASLGPNGVVYSVSLKEDVGGAFKADDHGFVTAHRVSDGQKLWKREVSSPPNSVPVVGRMSKDGPLLVVVGIGAQGGEPALMKKMKDVPDGPWKLRLHRLSIWLGDWSSLLWQNPPLPTEIWALDAATGEKIWSWEADNWYRMACAGDEEGLLYRSEKKVRGLCWPGPWSSPVIDSAGTLYAGSHNGKFYALRDSSGAGKIDEASGIDFKASFLFSSPALGPGILAMSSCDSLFVWRW